MFAGRNISASHVAFASTRVMATCAVVGEGVGVAAAFAAREGISPDALAANAATLDRIQQHLLREDLFLIGQADRGECSHAHTARITASSEQPDGPAINVISGQTRSAQTSRGVRPDRLIAGSHRWMSAPSEPLPAWLEFRWEAPITFSRIDLTFDSGLQRHLTLTHSDDYLQEMIWSRQPETVKDFCIETEHEGQWRELERVEGNWKRRYRKSLEAPISITALRITIYATGGLDHARIVNAAIY